MKRAAVLLVLALVAGCGGGRKAPSTFTVQGTLSLSSAQGEEGTGSKVCYALAGFTDVQAGAQITLKDDKGAIVAVGTLGGGTRPVPKHTCDFPFTFTSVPSRPFYTLVFGRRSAPTYTEADLKSGLHLSL